MITSVRNELYDRGTRPSASFDIPVISVGNLAVGGTGKTPMVEYLIRLLSPDYRLSTLSRGYGRTSSGFIVADASKDARTIGDEPLQIFKKYGDRIVVSVGEERAMAIPMILQQFEDTQVIILDDAFQHRRVRPSFQILLTDYGKPFFKDVLLPAGRLRESRKGAARADVVVVTKCPSNMPTETTMEFEEHIRQYSKAPVFFSTITYGPPIPFSGTSLPPAQDVILITGIASDEAFVSYVRQHFRMAAHHRFSDHHNYSAEEFARIASEAKKINACVICTEKDYVKLDAFQKEMMAVSFFYIPILTEFVKNGKEFDEMVLNAVRHTGQK